MIHSLVCYDRTYFRFASCERTVPKGLVRLVTMTFDDKTSFAQI